MCCVFCGCTTWGYKHMVVYLLYFLSNWKGLRLPEHWKPTGWTVFSSTAWNWFCQFPSIPAYSLFWFGLRLWLYLTNISPTFALVSRWFSSFFPCQLGFAAHLFRGCRKVGKGFGQMGCFLVKNGSCPPLPRWGWKLEEFPVSWIRCPRFDFWTLGENGGSLAFSRICVS